MWGALLGRWGCSRKTLHLQGAEVREELGSQRATALEEPTTLENVGTGTEQTLRCWRKGPSSWILWVCEGKKCGGNLIS